MDISFIADKLWVASTFYPLDEDLPRNAFLIDCEMDVDDPWMHRLVLRVDQYKMGQVLRNLIR